MCIRRARSLVVLALTLGLTAPACDHGEDGDVGADATLQVEGARFFRRQQPVDESGPRVRSATLGASAPAGATGRSCSGEVERAATAVAIAIAGDLGYWVVPAGLPSASALDAPTFDVRFGIARAARPGPRSFLVRAVDDAGRFGPPLAKPLSIRARGVAEGELVFALTWDDRANLDLHVVDPNGVEIFKRNTSSAEPPPPGAPREPPGTAREGGVLDFDANADCRTDGLGAENVVWKTDPPRGRYLVRVDTFSLCGEAASRWRLSAFLRGVRVGAAEGVGTEADTRFEHNRGAGVLALEVDVP
jgi:hypothetical protein